MVCSSKTVPDGQPKKNNQRTWRRTRYNPTLPGLQRRPESWHFTVTCAIYEATCNVIHCKMLPTGFHLLTLLTICCTVFFGVHRGFIFDCDLQTSPLIRYDICKSREPKMNPSTGTIKYIVWFSLYITVHRGHSAPYKSMNPKKDFYNEHFKVEERRRAASKQHFPLEHRLT